MGTLSNRDGIGATIAVTTAESTQRRTVTAGSSQMSQHMLAAHFGLGDAPQVDTLTVRWPSGRSQTLTDLAANQVLVVTEPDRYYYSNSSSSTASSSGRALPGS